MTLSKVMTTASCSLRALQTHDAVGLEEKPEVPKSNLACVGIYFYSSNVFSAIDKVEMSDRGEFEITSVNNLFIEKKSCGYAILEDVWSDAGTMDSYHNTNWLMYQEK